MVTLNPLTTTAIPAILDVEHLNGPLGFWKIEQRNVPLAEAQAWVLAP